MAVTDMREKGGVAASLPIAGGNKPKPITTLRDWLDHLAAHDRLAVIRPEILLQFELAAIAKRFDGHKATLFPRPGGYAMPVISGLVSDRQWIADAMGVDSVSYTHLRAHETRHDLVCRLLLEKKKQKK